MVEHIAKCEIQPGLCPMCDKTLAQGDSEVQDNYQWTDVSCPNCDWEGRQWDEIKFSGFTVYDEEKGETVNIEAADGELGVPEVQTPLSLSEQISRLPKQLRDHIHNLETNADPAGNVREIAALRENQAALEGKLKANEEALAGALRDVDMFENLANEQGDDCCESEW